MIIDDVFSIILYIDKNDNITGSFFENLFQSISSYFKNWELIVLNNSNDSKKIKQILSKTKSKKISYHKINYGETEDSSFMYGINYSVGDYIVEIPFSNLNNNLDFIFSNINTSYDIIFFENKSTHFIKKKFYDFFNKSLHNNNELFGSRFHVVSRRSLNQFISSGEIIINRRIIYTRITQNIKRIQLDYNTKSNYTLELLFDTLLFYSRITIKLTKFFWFSSILILTFMSIYSLILFFLGNVVEGWTTTILYLSFISFTISTLLYVVLKYLFFIFMLTNKNKINVVSQIEIFDN